MASLPSSSLPPPSMPGCGISNGSKAPTFTDHLLAMPTDDGAFDRLEGDAAGNRSLMYLLDTVVLSELRKNPPRRNPHVVSWLASVSPDDLFISAISIGEIERGIERQRSVDPAFATALTEWLDVVLRNYGERILPAWRRHRPALGKAVGADRQQRHRSRDCGDCAGTRSHDRDSQRFGFRCDRSRARRSLRTAPVDRPCAAVVERGRYLVRAADFAGLPHRPGRRALISSTACARPATLALMSDR